VPRRATAHTQNVTHKLKKIVTTLITCLKNATAQTAHLFFPKAKKANTLKNKRAVSCLCAQKQLRFEKQNKKPIINYYICN
jgi:UDP-3-O-[3-hydroxymyristoyl] glucosamine N-acyltransferase